ncbi:MAG: hypothetical protein AAB612_03390 [Patescibacteria group bacterium]
MTTGNKREEYLFDMASAGFQFQEIPTNEKVGRREYKRFNALQGKFNEIAENLNNPSAEPINMAAIFGDLLIEAASLEQRTDRIPCLLLLNRVLIALYGDVRYVGIYHVLNVALKRIQALALQAN